MNSDPTSPTLSDFLYDEDREYLLALGKDPDLYTAISVPIQSPRFLGTNDPRLLLLSVNDPRLGKSCPDCHQGVLMENLFVATQPRSRILVPGQESNERLTLAGPMILRFLVDQASLTQEAQEKMLTQMRLALSGAANGDFPDDGGEA